VGADYPYDLASYERSENSNPINAQRPVSERELVPTCSSDNEQIVVGNINTGCRTPLFSTDRHTIKLILLEETTE